MALRSLVDRLHRERTSKEKEIGRVPTEMPLSMSIAPAAPALLHMRWQDLLFLHWRIDPARIASRLPPGLTVDTWQGYAWIAAVPFRMQSVRPAGLPPLPGLSDFLELNLRTYVRDRQGRPGVWFFALDCCQPAAVLAARWGFGLRYRHARMWASPAGAAGPVRYHSRRPEGTSSFVYQRLGDWRTAEAGSLDAFLVERYRLFAWRPLLRSLWTGRVAHAPYAIAEAQARYDTGALWRGNGFAAPDRPADHVVIAQTVIVEAMPPVPVL